MSHDYKWKGHHGGFWGGSYFVSFLGAAVYFISQANGFWPSVGGFFKALVWPAFLVYHLLAFLKA